MVYERPTIVNGVTRADKAFFDNLLDGIDERVPKTVADATYATVWQASTAYAAGAVVRTPLGVFMARKTSGTSASTWAGDRSGWVPADAARGWVVTDFGAKGDGTTDDHTAIQAAFDAQAASTNPTGGRPAVFFPPGRYMTSATIVAGEGGFFAIRGDSVKSTYVVGTSALTGYVIEARAGFDVQDITINGNNKDGVYCFGYDGETDVDFSPTKVERVNFSEAEYCVRFAGNSQFPVKATWVDIYAFKFRTIGIQIALGGTQWSGFTPEEDRGQSAWTFDNVLITNGGGAAGVPINAAGLTVTADSPDTTHDALSWSGTDDTEAGYVIMRRATGSTDGYAWQVVTAVNSGTTSYSAAKTAGTTYDYKVYRNSIGLYVRRGKAIACNALQVERCGRGAWFEDCRGVSVRGFYYEFRATSTQADPGPRGDAITFSSSIGCHIEDAYVQQAWSGVTNRYSRMVSVDGLIIDGGQRSAIHIQSTDVNQATKIGLVACPSEISKVTTDGTTTAWHHSVISPGGDASNLHVLDHPSYSEYRTRYQGNTRAQLGGDSASGYLILSSGTLPTASSSYNGQVRRTAGKLWICVDQGAGYAWYPLTRGTELSTTQVELIGGARTDGSQGATFGYDGAGQPTASPNVSTKNFLVVRGGVQLGASGPVWRTGTGSPEGVLTAPVGSLYTRTDGGASTTLYVKESGAGNAGWVAK
ncbi:hypothetical protein FDJ57_gp22 [Gordonia phage Sour]|uniref:Minor tail protein n=1 Tax=Gordonia phage Sour TaxID=2182349 RepID=A0A2U8UKR7_9CAUD|nr:hypothetical protein FDJ57_gp22 [Gordonia phage Sour]AWN04223.1 minor tail protein [Gordonia phage Sour]